MPDHEKLHYVEFPAKDFSKTEAFFRTVFGWTFTHYGDAYMAFDYQGLEGGFYLSDRQSMSENGAALLVFYSHSLEKTQQKIEAAQGKISQSIFEFPGGRRFHFLEPSGNEFAVWSE